MRYIQALGLVTIASVGYGASSAGCSRVPRDFDATGGGGGVGGHAAGTTASTASTGTTTTSSSSGGGCGPGACMPGLVCCDGAGCVDTGSDPDHCGACANACAV